MDIKKIINKAEQKARESEIIARRSLEKAKSTCSVEEVGREVDIIFKVKTGERRFDKQLQESIDEALEAIRKAKEVINMVKYTSNEIVTGNIEVSVGISDELFKVTELVSKAVDEASEAIHIAKTCPIDDLINKYFQKP